MKTDFNPPRLGILGGAGPMASACFHQAVLRLLQQQGCQQDSDFPEILHVSSPLEAFNETGIADFSRVKASLQRPIALLKAADCDWVALPCNTLHCYRDYLEDALGVPVLNMVALTSRAIADAEVQRVCLLASESTYQMGLYQQELDAYGIEVLPVSKAQQVVVTEAILTVMGGHRFIDAELAVGEVGWQQVEAGAEGVVLACTELPQLSLYFGEDVPLFNSLQLLAQTTAKVLQP